MSQLVAPKVTIKPELGVGAANKLAVPPSVRWQWTKNEIQQIELSAASASSVRQANLFCASNSELVVCRLFVRSFVCFVGHKGKGIE